MLEFEYCECGCKGSLSEIIGEVQFWYHDSLKGKVCLHRGHGWTSPLIKECKSVEEAIGFATELASVLLEGELEKLKNIKKRIEELPKRLSFYEEVKQRFSGQENTWLRKYLRTFTYDENPQRAYSKIIEMSRSECFTVECKKHLLSIADAFYTDKVK